MFLDCTRLDGSKKLVSRKNSNSFMDVEDQVKSISDFLKLQGQQEIVLVDDVIFTGTVLRTLTKLFQENGIQVIGIRGAISMKKSFEEFSKEFPIGIKCGFILEEDVIDQICERDFYFGVAQSGISVLTPTGIYKSPYFKPFGNPVERASIPDFYEREFSIGCIKRSIALWKEIEKLSGKKIGISDLPESILNVEEKEVVKVLRKGMMKI